MAQIVGVPAEIKEMENRVACTPANARALCAQGNRVLIQSGAGLGSGFTDEDYQQAGAQIVPDADTLFAEATLILKVKEPLPAEFHRFREGQTLFTYLHLAANPEVTRMLLEKKVTAIAYENVVADGRLPLLEPMSEIAGRMSALIGAYYLSSAQGGVGVLASGVPGVAAAKVLVMGCGIAGVSAARMAAGMGCDVTVMDINVEKLRSLDHSLQGKVKTLYSNEHNLFSQIKAVDVLIGAVLVPGARAPRLITREILRQMKTGSVFIDIAIDQGGCAETSRPTSHSNPVYVEEGVLHYCVTNMPGAFAWTATSALTNVTLPFILKMAGTDTQSALRAMPGLAQGLNTHDGQIMHPAVAAAFSESPLR